jgi:hypothetical protein
MRSSTQKRSGGHLPTGHMWMPGWQAEESKVRCASCRSRVPRHAGDRKGGVFFCCECLERARPECPEFYDDLGVGD